MASAMLYACMFCVAQSMDLFVLCVVNCVVKQFAICLGVGVILLLHVMVLFSVIGVALMDRPCMVFQECVCFAFDPSVRLDAPSTCFVCVFVWRKLSPHLRV